MFRGSEFEKRARFLGEVLHPGYGLSDWIADLLLFEYGYFRMGEFDAFEERVLGVAEVIEVQFDSADELEYFQRGVAGGEAGRRVVGGLVAG